MAVQAQHLVVERFGSQRISAEEERAQIGGNDKNLVFVDGAKYARLPFVAVDFEVCGADFVFAARAVERPIFGVELRIDIQHLRLAVAARISGQFTHTAHFKQID